MALTAAAVKDRRDVAVIGHGGRSRVRLQNGKQGCNNERRGGKCKDYSRELEGKSSPAATQVANGNA
jgi:hypothetical protein